MNNLIPIPSRYRLGKALRPLLVLLMLCIGASGYAADNKVTLDARNVTLKSVLRSIEKQTDYRFFYSKETINVNVHVTVNVQNEPLTAVLDKILPAHGINYVINNKRISLNQASSATKDKHIKIVGTVTDTQGEPLIAASVVVKGSQTATVTNEEGAFQLNNVDPNATLRVSYIGYKTQYVSLKGRSDIKIVLQEDSKGLSEAIVIGYGTIDKKELTSAISHVSAKDFQSVAATDVSMLIQGKVPGLSVVNTAAADPNSANTRRIVARSKRKPADRARRYPRSKPDQYQSERHRIVRRA